MRKLERKIKESNYTNTESKKNLTRVSDQSEKLQSKVRNFKKQSEEATESAQMSASRYRKLQHELDEANERAELAEAAVAKSRNRQREQI